MTGPANIPEHVFEAAFSVFYSPRSPNRPETMALEEAIAAALDALMDDEEVTVEDRSRYVGARPARAFVRPSDVLAAVLAGVLRR